MTQQWYFPIIKYYFFGYNFSVTLRWRTQNTCVNKKWMRIQYFTMMKCGICCETNIWKWGKRNNRKKSYGSFVLIPFLVLDTIKGVVILYVSLERWLVNVILRYIFSTYNEVLSAIFQNHPQGISNFWAAKNYQGQDNVSTFTTKSSLFSRQRKCLSHLTLREWQPY